jgi:hypothetical protein
VSDYRLSRVTRDWVPTWLWHLFCIGNVATWEPFRSILTRKAGECE